MNAQLPHKRPLLVRPIRPDDKPLLDAALGRLSAQSARARFLAAKPRLSSSELTYLTEVDGNDHHALVAVRAERPDELVAVARYVRLHDDPTTAEMAIVVADEHQGRGLGRRLGLALADHAREQGIRRFVGLMLSDNQAAHALFDAISDRVSTGREQLGVHRVVAELAA